MKDDPYEAQFGQLEQQMGQDAYQSNVKLAEAQADAVASQAEHNRKQIELMEMQRASQRTFADAHAQMYNAMSNVVYIVAIGLVPVVVMFWVYLFKEWVL